MAKKKMKEPDLKGAIDYVLTYEELRICSPLRNWIWPACRKKMYPCFLAGICQRLCRRGGGSESRTVHQLNSTEKFRSRPAGPTVCQCRAMIDDILKGNREGNFFEGMGCKGGCVRGPKALISKERRARPMWKPYGRQAMAKTPGIIPT